MSPEEARSISVNHALDDEELREIQALEEATMPGDWYARPGPDRLSGRPTGRIERFDRTPVEDAASVLFMAKAKGFVPRLLRHIDALELAWRTAKAEAASWKEQRRREQEAHEAALARASEGRCGPPEDLGLLASAVRLGVLQGPRTAKYLEHLITQWARGASLHDDLSDLVIRAEAEVREAERARLVAQQKERASLEALLGVSVSDDHDYIARTAIFSFLASPKGAEALRSYMVKHHPALMRKTSP